MSSAFSSARSRFAISEQEQQNPNVPKSVEKRPKFMKGTPASERKSIRTRKVLGNRPTASPAEDRYSNRQNISPDEIDDLYADQEPEIMASQIEYLRQSNDNT